MKKEKKTITKSFRLSEDVGAKISSLAELKHCSQSQVITDALMNKCETLDTKSLYRAMMRVHDALIPIENKSNVDTSGVRRELMEICHILNSNEKTTIRDITGSMH